LEINYPAGVPTAEFNWIAKIAAAANEALKNGYENRAILICQQSKTAIELAYGTPLIDKLLDSIAKSAKNKQATRLAESGKIVDQTICFNQLRVYLLKCEASNYEGMSEVELRTAAMLAWRIISFGRCEDITKTYEEQLVFFPKGTSFSNCNKVTSRLLGSKSTKGDNRDAHKRPSGSEAFNQWSSKITILNTSKDPDHVRPNVFRLMAAYVRKRGIRHHKDAPVINGARLNLLFTGANKYPTPLMASTASAAQRRLLVSTGCIDVDSALQSKHTRHSALSNVFWYAPERMFEALQQARHAAGTFEHSYQLPINEVSLASMMAMKHRELRSSKMAATSSKASSAPAPPAPMRLEDMVWH
jgi:hypothetical protein